MIVSDLGDCEHIGTIQSVHLCGVLTGVAEREIELRRAFRAFAFNQIVDNKRYRVNRNRATHVSAATTPPAVPSFP